MAEIARVSERLGASPIFVHRWNSMKKGDVGNAIELPSLVSLHAQIIGNIGIGKVTIEGSNTAKPGPDDWAVTVDQSSFPVEFITTSFFKVVGSVPRWLRPVASGDDAMDIGVLLIVREPS